MHFYDGASTGGAVEVKSSPGHQPIWGVFDMVFRGLGQILVFGG